MRFPHRLYVSAVIAVALLAFFGVPQAAFAGPLAEDSYYQLDVALEGHDGSALQFSAHRSAPMIVSMFYGSCPHVCPMLISTIQQVEKSLDAASREKLRVLMVTVDPERDTPAALADIGARHKVDASRWTLARTANAADTRALAAVLGIKYKALPDGQFNHTSAMILLDAEGREIARSGKLGAPEPAFVEQVRRALTR